MDITRIKQEDVEWTELAQIMGFCDHSNEPSVSVNDAEPSVIIYKVCELGRNGDPESSST
jgi:hypothetical protein